MKQYIADFETSFDAKKLEGKERKEWEYRVCLRVWSERPCPDDTCTTVKFVRDFQTYNVFTPGDNNGKNDKFNPKVKGNTFYNIMIFNRWGEIVFESENPDEDWNGQNFNTGPECPAGTYFYMVTYDPIGRTQGISLS